MISRHFLGSVDVRGPPKVPGPLFLVHARRAKPRMLLGANGASSTAQSTEGVTLPVFAASALHC